MKTIVGIKEDYNWSSEDGRRQLIMRGFVYMQYYPIAGVGINNFERAECMSELSTKVRAYVRGTGIRCTAPHNTYIQAGAETGYTGFILFLSLVFGGIWRMRKLRRKIPRTWRGGDADRGIDGEDGEFLQVAARPGAHPAPALAR
jgi:O-antigen ligase